VAQYPDEFVDVVLELSRLMPAEEALEGTLDRVANPCPADCGRL